jgi:hypothetical protein
VQEQPASQVSPACAKALGVAGHAEGLSLDRLEDAVRQHDLLAGDVGQRADRERCALVLVEVARTQLEHAAAVDVAHAHETAHLDHDALCPVAVGRHDLEVSCSPPNPSALLSMTTTGSWPSRTSHSPTGRS